MLTQPLILIHGSWHTGFAWHKTQHALAQLGARSVYAPNLLGMEARHKPSATNFGLHQHIQQIADFITHQALERVMLVGHSYAGFVIAGVAERVPEKLAALVFLDAFIPENNQALFDVLPAQSVEHMRSVLVDDGLRSKAEGAREVWLIPPSAPDAYGVKDAADIEILKPHMVYTPVATFEEKLTLNNPRAQAVPRYFIRCTEFGIFAAYENQARQLGWPVYQIPTGHDAMVTEPERLAAILSQIASQ